MEKIVLKNYADVEVYGNNIFSDFIFYNVTDVNISASNLKSKSGIIKQNHYSADFYAQDLVTSADYVYFIFPSGDNSLINGVETERVGCYIAEADYYFVSKALLNTYVVACQKSIVQDVFNKNQTLFKTNCFCSHECYDIVDTIRNLFNLAVFSDKDLFSLIDTISNNLILNGKAKTGKCGNELIRSVFEYICKNQERQLFIYEICDLFNISRRSLEFHYKRCFNVTIGQHIKYIKLIMVRKRLLDHRINYGNIISTLESLGIHHPSHFGQIYKGFFGETMSKTIDRI
jgi:AraC-like DNA-binding protein